MGRIPGYHPCRRLGFDSAAVGVVTRKVGVMLRQLIRHAFPYGLAVRIPGSHPGGPGSTPGMGNHLFQMLEWLLEEF